MDEVPTEEAVVAAIVSGSLDRGAALEGLALALRALVEQAGLSFILVLDNGQSTPRPIYAGKHYSRMRENERLHRRFHPRQGLSLTVHHRPSHLDLTDPEELMESLRGYLPIMDELRRACFTCPVPLLWKGGQLDGLLGSAELGLERPNRLMLLRGLRGLKLSPERLPLPGDFEEKVPSLLSHPFRLSRSYGGSRLAQGVLVLSVRLDPVQEEGHTRRCSRLLWLNDGVVVQEERLSLLSTHTLQLTVLANAEGLSTDLTGFSLLDNDEFRLRREEVLRAAGQALRQHHTAGQDLYGEDRDEFSYRDDGHERRQTTSRRLKGFLRVSGSAVAVVILSPLITAPVVLALLVSRYSSRRCRGGEGLLARKEEVVTAISNDLACAVELLTGDKPPPPPAKRVEFVVRRR